MKTTTATHYERRFERVIDHIYAHLDQPLDLLELADIACVSPYHWHRMYRGLYGETPAQTVKRLRLQRAAKSLVKTPLPVKVIAAKAGYSTIQAFNRAFSASFGITPTAYRHRAQEDPFDTIHSIQSSTGNTMNNIEIRQIQDFHVAGIPHQGDYMNIGHSFEKFYGWAASHQLLEQLAQSIGIYYEDPASTPVAELRSLAGARFQQWPDNIDDTGLTVEHIQAGDYAVMRHTGSYATLEDSYNWLYREWLPQSGREPADAPPFEEYINNPREVAPNALITDIYIPLK
ncbi:Regulatory protein SoxS [BD1-7 clade bacterium]|uniref:Regulatory protein SoxS n=1 Tax=BD1-7 clade bacterium TaxID=2029982 RepID=A0A5S9QRE4_9GAMM|nr:Regulatory protein SoxS [BD1-7 clade bacterium]